MHHDTIVALATPSGAGAVAIIRISGKDVLAIAHQIFISVKGKDLRQQKTHTIHLGSIVDDTKVIDQVLVAVFKNPNSYTGEDVVEISCHGSTFIQQQIIQLLLRKGCRMAQAGEFTLRAFLNGKLDAIRNYCETDVLNTYLIYLRFELIRGAFSFETYQKECAYVREKITEENKPHFKQFIKAWKI